MIKDQYSDGSVVSPILKRICTTIVSIIFILVAIATWFEKTIDGEDTPFIFKLLFSYYLISAVVLMYLISYRYNREKHDLLPLAILQLGAGIGLVLSPFIWPLYFFPDLAGKIFKKAGLTLSDKIESSDKKDG